MIQIKGKEYNSREFKPSYTSESDDYIKNDRKIASDNIKVKPLSISSTIFYKIKNDSENKNDSIKFIQDIIYNQEMITVVDLDNSVEYNDLFISVFNIQKKYKEGFLANIEFRYNPITETAMSGKKKYEGYSIRNERIIQKTLLKKQIPINDLPEKTIKNIFGDSFDYSLQNNKIINLNYLDFDSEKLKQGIAEKIQTNIKGFNGVFELNPDGTFDIFDSLNNPIKMGQRILVDVELLANTIPGVDVSLKLLPITQQASVTIFDISRLGEEFILNVNELKKDIDML